MTPSRETNSSTLIFRITELLSASGTHLAPLALSCSWEPYAGMRNPRLAPHRQRLVNISQLQHPTTADVLLGLQVRPVGDEPLTIGPRPQRLRLADGGEAAKENHDTGGRHLFIERVDSADRCFALGG